MAYIGEHSSMRHGMLLGSIVHAMSRREWGLVNAGFLNEINRYAMAAATVVEEVNLHRP